MAVEGRRLKFTVEAFDLRRKIGEGTQERAIVHLATFAARARSQT